MPTPNDPLGKAFIDNGTILGVYGIIIYLPFVTLPLLLPGRYCPTGTFAHGALELYFEFPCLIVSAYSYFLLVHGYKRREDGVSVFNFDFMNLLVDHHWKVFFYSILCICLVAGFFWINRIGSYYCLMPDNILIRQSIFSRGSLVGWDKVFKVEASCGHTKNGPYGGLTLSVSNKPSLWISLGAGGYLDEQEYYAIDRALEGHTYAVVGDRSLRLGRCPPNIFRMFSGPF